MDRCVNPDCRAEFSLLNRPYTCVYCGKDFCHKCVIKKGKFRKKDYFCENCYTTIEKKILSSPTARSQEIKEQLAEVSEKSAPQTPDRRKSDSCASCGSTASLFSPLKTCIFCEKDFCSKCVVFENKFRKTDHFCRDCVEKLSRSVMISPDSRIDGFTISKVIRPISSLRYRSRELTEFFLKWQAQSLGANAVLGYKTAPSLDKSRYIGAGTAVVLLKEGAPEKKKSDKKEVRIEKEVISLDEARGNMAKSEEEVRKIAKSTARKKTAARKKKAASKKKTSKKKSAAKKSTPKKKSTVKKKSAEKKAVKKKTAKKKTTPKKTTKKKTSTSKKTTKKKTPATKKKASKKKTTSRKKSSAKKKSTKKKSAPNKKKKK